MHACSRHFELNFADKLITQPGHTDVRYWHTLGYSYCCILWAWAFALGFLITKVMLPGLVRTKGYPKTLNPMSGLGWVGYSWLVGCVV